MDTDTLRNRRWVLLPGTLCNEEVFDGFLDSIGVEKPDRFPIVLKHSRSEDYLPALKELICDGAVVCGFSLGAIVAAHLADRLDASALVLFGLNPFADDPAKAPARRKLSASLRTEGWRCALESQLPPILGPSPIQTKEHILSMAGSTASLIEQQTTLALTRPGAMTALAAARCPIRLLTGSEDTSAPFELARMAAQVAIDGQALKVDGLGHYALLEDPERCHATLSADSCQPVCQSSQITS